MMAIENPCQFRIAEIEVNKSTLDEKIIGVFRYDADLRSRAPSTLLILAEITSTLYCYEQLLDAINEAAEQVRPLVSGADLTPIARFEKVTQRINDAIAAFVAHEPTPISWNRVNIFLLQLSDGHLCFSGIGRLSNLFLQKQKDGSYRTFDLFGSLDPVTEINPEKPFSSLICGDMHVGDVLFAGSLNIQRHFQTIDLQERLKSLPPVTAALELRQALEQTETPDDFAGVVIASVQLTPQPITPPKAEPANTKPKSTESVEKLLETEERAEHILSPIITPLSSADGVDIPEFSTPLPPPTPRMAILLSAARSVAVNSIQTIRERLTRTQEDDDPLAAAQLRSMHAGHGLFFTRERKIQLIVGVVILLVMASGGFWYKQHRAFLAAQQLWNTVYDQAVDRKTTAEADQVMGNEDRARQLVIEAKALVSGLDEKTPDRQKARTELLQGLEDIQAKLRHAIVVEHPEALYTLPADAGDVEFSVLALQKNRLLAVHPQNNSLIRIDPATKDVRVIATPQSLARITQAAGTADGIVFATEQKQLATLNSADEVIKLTFSTVKASSTQAIALYGKRLYALDPLHGMVWRYTKNAEGYGQESAYLKQNSRDLTQATGIAIDSNVYLAFRNGTTGRYLSGAEEAFDLRAIDPPLQNAAGIWTGLATDRLVIADAVGKRVLVYRKDGLLITQYTSPDFVKPLAVTADEAAKKIYIADGKHIFALDLP
ncbi:MAG: hypothetical protein WCV84_03595 [Patescibacteria group bacterium]